MPAVSEDPRAVEAVWRRHQSCDIRWDLRRVALHFGNWIREIQISREAVAGVPRRGLVFVANAEIQREIARQLDIVVEVGSVEVSLGRLNGI